MRSVQRGQHGSVPFCEGNSNRWRKYPLSDISVGRTGDKLRAMRALVYVAPGRVQLEERPRHKARAGELEIAVEMAGVCGSDIAGFVGHSRRRRPPLVLGHELVGRLVNGHRVVANPLISCRGCRACLSGAQNLCEDWRLLGMDRTDGSFAEFVVLPATQIYEIPEELTAARAVLTEPLANIVHLLRIAAPPPFLRLAIVGGGTMGALALIVAKRTGARDVLVADVSDDRLTTARELGAAATVNTGSAEGAAEARERAGRGFDLVLDSSGSAPARQLAFDLCRAGGTVVLLGMASETSEVNFVTSIRKEHRVVMSFAYTPPDFERALALLRAGEVALDRWTEKFPLEHGQEALERISRAPGATLKVLREISRKN
jgi:2-desacetyl-2-hydroxyethyl bacteriochlorophyllide A dehydrogenase